MNCIEIELPKKKLAENWDYIDFQMPVLANLSLDKFVSRKLRSQARHTNLEPWLKVKFSCVCMFVCEGGGVQYT